MYRNNPEIYPVLSHYKVHESRRRFRWKGFKIQMDREFSRECYKSALYTTANTLRDVNFSENAPPSPIPGTLRARRNCIRRPRHLPPQSFLHSRSGSTNPSVTLHSGDERLRVKQAVNTLCCVRRGATDFTRSIPARLWRRRSNEEKYSTRTAWHPRPL